ncbi:Sedoheptulose-1,7-bisphosphatase-like protein [Hapsidospora chrysogenum ATCC 11550]|uniref:Sedoheptulose-1,7-bisphosphatase-like protein n=1 Tax=Hapsidospora chrysogenum (strain ATCC 11550 / CBS 779.69 / DSM 880 / IAM 14645 / JCM 23072 / IMI 49137) TaxID=857340 RepID=A0A086SXY4_HAPC1|nr:Sedoheptulose-1,7-bisphosphatase-like protein [Hapsidospora chrysogenum ATCC 11550]
MADSFAGSPALQAHLESLLPEDTRPQLRTSVIPSLLSAIADVSHTLRISQHVALAGSSNEFGDDQLNVDVSAEKHIRSALAGCAAVATASSEEDPVERSVGAARGRENGVGGERYTVAFDPLDGSSIIGPNWTVGTIVGVWDGETALGQSPREKQIAAILGVFGPRTTAVVAIRIPGSEPSCFELGLGGAGDGGTPPTWQLIRPNVQLARAPYKTRYFSPANLRSASEDPRYMSLVTERISKRYTLRYSGGLVPDVVHALCKGHGLYVSPVTAGSGAKLRKLYELLPVALIVECAGGKAVDSMDGRIILGEAPLGSTDERGGLVCGNEDEVEEAVSALLG